MAAAFVKRLGEHLDCNINIMDRDGVIIASRDPERVGSYHEAARRLVERGSSIESIPPGPSLPVGVRPGVNLPILLRGEIIGVVGVTGDPAAVEPVAYAVKTSVESMVELELFKEQAMRRQDRKNLFVNRLLFEADTPRAELDALAAKLGYDPVSPRAPVLFRLRPGLAPEKALAAIKSSAAHGAEDISWVAPDGAILVWKRLPPLGEGLMERYHEAVEAYVSAIDTALDPRHGGRPVDAVYAGAIQTDLARYRGAYRQTLWLAARYPQPTERIMYLYDHLSRYIANRVPRADLVDALEGVAALVPAELVTELAATVDALFASAFNAKEAAARLGIHRNTLAARMERLGRMFGFDPRHDARALEFLAIFVRYLELRSGGKA